MNLLFRFFTLGWLAWVGGNCSGAAAVPAGENEPGAALFAKPRLLNITLAISSESQASLRKAPREWVSAAVLVDGQEFAQVAVHLKSSTSFLPLDKKPSLTLNFSRHAAGRRLFGLRKIHLNNSVQDPSYLGEYLAGELFRKSGVPCARVAWAKVRLNGRDLGLYVLKEGMTPEFLGLHFKETDGNFYDGGLHHEIDEPLELESGKGPKDHSDLRALYVAAVTPDPSSRWQQLQQLLDVDRFVAMMAMESLACHIDGYSAMQNNYRIYFAPPSRRAVFVTHGMDRMFEQPDLALPPPMVGVLSKAVMAAPEGRRLYRNRLVELSGKVLQPEWMTNRIEQIIRLLEPAEPLVTAQARALQERILMRVEFVRKQLKELRL